MVNIISIISLAAVDAINPCVLAVMAMVLMSILLHNPEKKNVLLGGLAFTFAVFILYFLYGLIMVQFFSKIIPATENFSNYVFKGFGLLAILLGILNFKDYLYYQPGGIATEMPMKLRPRLRMIIKTITSPKGAFFVGIIVTLFLLPCTIGPYIIASGKLSELNFIMTLPYLLLYNLIFIIPMIIITLIIYFGVSRIEQVSDWREKNIKYLHLIEAVILIILGILMFTGIL